MKKEHTDKFEWVILPFGRLVMNPQYVTTISIPCEKSPGLRVGWWSLADVCHTKNGNDDEALANARLMAAAPELLEALETLVEWALHPGESGRLGPKLLKADTAIKKAMTGVEVQS